MNRSYESRRGDSLRSLIAGAETVLADAGVPSPRHDAEILASHLLGVRRGDLVLAPELPDDFSCRYAELVECRRRRKPLQHIVGVQGFRYLSLHVTPGVFVPRPETEVLAGLAVDEAKSLAQSGTPPLVVDLCCGAGGVALAIDTEVPDSTVAAIDVSEEAVWLTRRNNAELGTGTMRIESGDVTDEALLADLNGSVDIVVSNPPYIPPGAEPNDPEVRDHDPFLALYGGGADGLTVPTATIRAAKRLLRPGGMFAMEHADTQGEAVRALLTVNGFGGAVTLPDLSGRDRVSTGRIPGAARHR
ncbi:peptide chain release factor N(5)-glutamine methyltransferase [Spelaeicoccus albus]|uniref:Release factor glutamine methyltransferase n=1 Tax=Spelaeicoccus albus TaxID=1280376 RepID=A0A7Z0D527_9MICO|nr:peptide chain release factor N(5)-glutamine methyltransferase [Spelaeicoccus albus]NYI68978.1 release factor glutamine methyltransferase [Spelaeicoccus albus]